MSVGRGTCLSTSLSVYCLSLSAWLSISPFLSACLSLSLTLSACLSLFQFFCLRVSLSLCLSVFQSLPLCLYVSLSLSACLSVCLCLSARPSLYGRSFVSTSPQRERAGTGNRGDDKRRRWEEDTFKGRKRTGGQWWRGGLQSLQWELFLWSF